MTKLTLSRKGAKREPAGAKRTPKGAKVAPKVTKSEPRGTKREPKGTKKKPKEPKGSQRMTQMAHKIDTRKRVRKRVGPQRFWEPFWNHFEH